MKKILKHGDLTTLAEAANISKAYLCDILHRRRGVGFHMAQRLSKAFYETLGLEIPIIVWLTNKTSKHAIFK